MDPILVESEAELTALGGRLGRALRPGDVVALRGGLGVGKTTLTRGLVQAQAPGTDVPSPTYTIVQTYDLPDYELWHCDAYRLEHPDEVFELGLLEAMDEAVVMIEWPDRLGDHMPDDAMGVTLDFRDSGRQVVLTGWEGRDIGA